MTGARLALACRLAWRETRAGWRPLGVLVACVAVGVAALVAVTGVAARLDRAIAREARALVGGDLELRAARPLDPAARAAVASLAARGAAVARTTELATMARRADGRATALVELKAVGGAYPLYGRVETRPAGPLAALLAGGGAVADEALLARLGVAVGDVLLVGAARVVVRAVLVVEPDRAARLVTLGPRLLVDEATLAAARLVQPGSRVRYRTLLRLPPSLSPAAARAALADAVTDPGVRVSTAEEARPGWRRFTEQLAGYLGLVGLASLLVGSVGVAAAVRAFVARKQDTIATLACLGAAPAFLHYAYLLQATGLGLAGSLVGAGLGAALTPAVSALLAGLTPLAVERGPEGWALVRGVAIGTAVTALVAFAPLGAVREVPAARLFRRDVEPRRARGPRRWLRALPLAAGATALVLGHAPSVRVGLVVVGAVVVALGLLAGLGRALAWFGRRSPRLPWLVWRQGLANLARPGGHGPGVVVALGLGVTLLVAVGVLQASLGRQLDQERRRETPSFFFVDILPAQGEPFARLVRERGGAPPTLTPVVRGRLAAVDGEPVTRALVERRRAEGEDTSWYYTRDYVLTAAAALPPGNAVVAGRWWRGDGAGPPEASVEVEAARGLGVGVGSRLAFDLQGVRLEAVVTSLRHVDWQTFAANFFVLLSPGALDGAPTTYLATARVPRAAEAALQDAVATAFPNVVAIPVREVLERVARLLDRMALAVRVLAALAVAAGLVVMAGALTASRAQRLRESAILRTLGATRGVVARVFAVEYLCLGLAAGAGGTALGAALAWAVLRGALGVPPVVAPAVLAAGVGLPALLALAVGGLATWRLLGAPPLAVLRDA